MAYILDGCSFRVAHPWTTLCRNRQFYCRNFISKRESRMLRRDIASQFSCIFTIIQNNNFWGSLTFMFELEYGYVENSWLPRLWCRLPLNLLSSHRNFYTELSLVRIVKWAIILSKEHGPLHGFYKRWLLISLCAHME